ncbi:MAG: TolC family protein [Chitinophagales bacterium]|nr:TolC family protein [Chitinophagales bacterium]
MMRIILYSFLSLIGIQEAHSQALLSLEEAIDIALKNNYNIIISKNQAEIADNNATKGNAGFWPTVSLNTGGNFNWNTISNQKLSSGTDYNLKNQTSSSLNGNVTLNWTIFDGKKMFATFDKLNELKAIGDLQVKSDIEKLIYDISISYYNIVSQQLQLSDIERNIAVSEERFKLEKSRQEVGKSNQLMVMQAQIDYNAMLSQQSTQKNLIAVEKTKLNQLLARDLITPFSTDEEIQIQDIQSVDSLIQKAHQNNTELQILEKYTVISELALKEKQAEKYPTISLNSSYGYNQTNNSGGFSKSNNNLGLTSGLSLKWNIFDGGRVKREVSNAQILVENENLALKDALLNVQSTIQQAILNFNHALSVVRIEEQSYQLALESLEIVKEKFRLGVANTLELKDAQNVFEQSTSRKNQALNQAKIAEINLQYLTGQLAVQ